MEFPHDVQWGQMWKVNNCYLMWLPPYFMVKSSPHELMSIFLPAISKMIPNILHSWQYSDWWKWGLILPNSPYMALKLTHKTPIISPTCIQARQSSSLIEWWGSAWQGDLSTPSRNSHQFIHHRTMKNLQRISILHWIGFHLPVKDAYTLQHELLQASMQ